MARPEAAQSGAKHCGDWSMYTQPHTRIFSGKVQAERVVQQTALVLKARPLAQRNSNGVHTVVTAPLDFFLCIFVDNGGFANV